MSRPRPALLVGFAAVAMVGVVIAVVLSDGRGAPAPGLRGIPVRDATDTISVVLPPGWSDINLEPLVREDGNVPRIHAAPDRGEYTDRRDAPGMEYLFTAGLERQHIARVLDEVGERTEAGTRCDSRKRRAFDHRGFEGTSDEYSGCATKGTSLVVIAALDPSDRGLAVLAVQAATDGERALVLDTFTVSPEASP